MAEFDVAELGPGRTYKLLVASVVPRPIAFVTTLSRDGVVNAAPFSYFNLMGHAPPVVAIGVGERSRGTPKDTGLNLREHGELVVNLVDEDLAPDMVACATDFPYGMSEVEEVGLATTPSVAVAPPRIARSPIHLECRHHSTIEIGRTRVTLAEVVHFAIRDDLFDAERYHVRTEAAHLVGRMHGRGYYTRTRDLFDEPRMSYDEWRARQAPESSDDD